MFSLDIPLHPIVVHFPIALGVITPILFVIALIGISKFNWPYKAWVVPVIFQIALFLTALGAKELGEDDEDKVETVIEKALIHEHEEWGERFVILQGAILVLTGVGLIFPGRIRLKKAGTVFSIIGIAGVVLAGHSGGQLVYKYNAGRAYLAK
jgi:hypothetical protein